MRKKKNIILFIVPIAILLVFFSVFLFLNLKTEAKQVYETKTSQGEVVIDLTPREFKDGKLYFDIGVNTHTVELENYDLKKLTILSYGGLSYKPALAPILSGHHNSGTLVFEVEDKLEEFTITINSIPDVEERVFIWP